MEIRIPKLGEGVNSGTVVNVLVSEGDAVTKDQTVLELETEKAVAPIPSPAAGKVAKVLVKQGDVVAIGQSVISLAEGEASSTAETPQSKNQNAVSSAKKPASTQDSDEEHHHSQSEPASEDYSYQSKSGAAPPASPTVRKLARDLGIDLSRVRGSESGGRIVLEDVKAYIQRLQQLSSSQSKGSQVQKTQAPPVVEKIDFSKWGPVTRKPLSNLRRTIGQKMVESWTRVPHVTQFDEANITALMALRKKYAPAYEKKGAKLTLTSFIMKQVAVALKKYPVFNASLDEEAGELVYKDYFHLGVAVDTEAGLIVPIFKDVDKKSILEISVELEKVAEKTRQRKISLDEIQGGTFNISNLGSIGGTFFTPIVSLPQVAVLGVGRGVLKPIAQNQKIEIASMLPLGLSYDHRVIDGADGARFIREIVEGLEAFSEKDVAI